MQELVPRVYDCALQPKLWPDVLQDIAAAAGGFGAMIFDCAWHGTQEAVSLRYCSAIYDPALVGGYVETFNSHEVLDQGRFARLSSLGDEVNLIRCDDLYASRATIEATPKMQAMMEFGIYYRAGALLSKDSSAMDRFALQFRKHHGPISESAHLAVQGLLPHVAKSLSIGRAFQMLEADRHPLAQVLEEMPFGIAIVRTGGAVVQKNNLFDELASGFRLFSPLHKDTLQLGVPPPALQALLAPSAAHRRFGARPLREAAVLAARDSRSLPGEEAKTWLFIEISPLRSHPEFGTFDGDCYLVSLMDSRRAHHIDADTVKRYFPMTDAELSVLKLVVRGHSNSEIADLRGRSPETVNSQMKSLISKSGARNRTEVVRIAVGLCVAALTHR